MKQCTIDSCDNQHYAKGLCKKHYAQHLRGTLTDESRTTEDIIAELREYESLIDAGINSKNENLASLFTLLRELLNQ
jgi:hypothetical protein